MEEHISSSEVEEVEELEEVDDISECKATGNGYGKINVDKGALIFEKFGVKAACRKRDGWEWK